MPRSRRSTKSRATDYSLVQAYWLARAAALALHYIDSAGRLHDTMPLLSGLADRTKGLTADAFAPASDGIRDHLIRNYITALEKNLP